MAEILVPPFFITYEGKDADEHIIHAQQLGESIIGASKLYAAVAHYCMIGAIPRGNYRKIFQCYAKPPQDGSFEYQLLIAAIGNEWALHGDIYKEGLSALLYRIIAAIKNIWLKPTETRKVISELSSTVKELSLQNNAIAMTLANGISRSNDNITRLHECLILQLPHLAEATRNHARELVKPVGSTCNSVTQFSHSKEEFTITEPEAEVIRGGTEMEIDKMQEFKCKQITEVNVKNGHCLLNIEGLNGIIPGTINDPALELPNNIYTRSLNNQGSFIIFAKPIKRNGVIQKLHISDAKEGR